MRVYLLYLCVRKTEGDSGVVCYRLSVVVLVWKKYG